MNLKLNEEKLLKWYEKYAGNEFCINKFRYFINRIKNATYFYKELYVFIYKNGVLSITHNKDILLDFLKKGIIIKYDNIKKFYK